MQVNTRHQALAANARACSSCRTLPDKPDNLVIRLSRSKIDGPVPAAWTHDSGVTNWLETNLSSTGPGRQVWRAVDNAGQSLLNLLYTVNIKMFITQNIIKNYASVINWIRQLAKNRRRLGISVRLVRPQSIKLQE